MLLLTVYSYSYNYWFISTVHDYWFIAITIGIYSLYSK